MFRLIFKKRCPRTRRLDQQAGPWHRDRETVERWIVFFRATGHGDEVVIQEAKNISNVGKGLVRL